MVAFGHTSVGALVGLGIYHVVGQSNPILGLSFCAGVGIVSHYIADFIPHGHFFSHKDFKKKIIWAILFDFLLSVVLFSGIVLLTSGYSWKFWYVLFGIIGANLPDILDGWYYLKVIPNRGLFKLENRFHQSTHWHGIFEKGKLIDGQPMKGYDIWQVIMVLISLFANLKF